MKRNLTKAITIIVLLLMLSLCLANGSREAELDFNQCVLRTIILAEDVGGYYTGREPKEELENNAWEGMDMAVTLEDGTVTVDLTKARPSFCSSATYMALLNALTE